MCAFKFRSWVSDVTNLEFSLAVAIESNSVAWNDFFNNFDRGLPTDAFNFVRLFLRRSRLKEKLEGWTEQHT